MTPNQVTVARIGLAFTAVAFFGRTLWLDVAALGLTIGAVSLDAVDGYIARRRKLATPLGAQFDILGDRLVENLFFTLFAVAGLVSLWVPVTFLVRGMLTDFLRSLAALHLRAGFGKNSMLETAWGRLIVASRGSRAAYAALKCVCFCVLGLELTFRHLPSATLQGGICEWICWSAQALVVASVLFCIIRAVPVLWEGRRYLGAGIAQAQAVPETNR